MEQRIAQSTILALPFIGSNASSAHAWIRHLQATEIVSRDRGAVQDRFGIEFGGTARLRPVVERQLLPQIIRIVGSPELVQSGCRKLTQQGFQRCPRLRYFASIQQPACFFDPLSATRHIRRGSHQAARHRIK